MFVVYRVLNLTSGAFRGGWVEGITHCNEENLATVKKKVRA